MARLQVNSPTKKLGSMVLLYLSFDVHLFEIEELLFLTLWWDFRKEASIWHRFRLLILTRLAGLPVPSLVCTGMYACIGACVYVCICIYVCVYLCIHIYIRARVGVNMRSCNRILFICTVQSLYYMRVYHRCFLTPACVCVGGLEVGFVSVCSWLALVTGVGGYVLAGVEIGVLSCIFLYFCGC